MLLKWKALECRAADHTNLKISKNVKYEIEECEIFADYTTSKKAIYTQIVWEIDRFIFGGYFITNWANLSFEEVHHLK